MNILWGGQSDREQFEDKKMNRDEKRKKKEQKKNKATKKLYQLSICKGGGHFVPFFFSVLPM